MARTRCYRDGAITAEDFPLEDISEHLREPDSVVWVDLCTPETGELTRMAAELGLHALAVEDARQRRQRPKLDRYSDHAFISAYAIEFDPDSAALAAHEVSVFLTERAMVTVRQDDGFAIDEVVKRWDEEADLAKNGVAFLLYGLLDYLVDTHFNAVEALDEQIEGIEDELFAEHVNRTETNRRTFQLRKALVKLRRVVLPMREVVNTLLRRDQEYVEEAMEPYYQDIYDHVLRATEWTESLRDMVNSVLETNLTIQGNRLNVITKQVTGWAAIIAVPTAVTGFYGMNVPYPGYEKWSGFLVSSVLIVGLSGLLYALFRRRDWL